MARLSSTHAACAVSAALRLGFVWAHDPNRHAELTDYQDYLRQAEHLLARTSGPEDTFMPVGLSWWIALGKVLRLPPIWLPLWQVFASVATVALVGLAVRRLAQSERAGAYAAWVAALYPPFLFYLGFLFTETTTAALIAVAIAVAAGGLTRSRDRAAVGLALGVAVVWRTNVALVPVIWGAVSLVASGLRAWIRGPQARVLGWAALPIAAATLRASLLLGTPSGPAANGGVIFLLSHSDWTEVHVPYTGSDAPGGVRVIHFFRNRRRAQEAVYHGTEPIFRESPLYAEAWRSILRHSARELGRVPLSWLDGIGLGREGYYPRTLWYDLWLDGDRWMEASRGPLGLAIGVPAIAWAVWRILRRKRVEPGEGLVVATVAAAIVTFTVYLSEPRMRIPFDPAFIVAAVLTWTAATRRVVALRSWRVRLRCARG